ncbi:MAG: hypothetical protein PF795_13875 [Kiritimatiellae bacterium]|jgi:beta-glucuronidase|nr:hypothetical protein [Kiritimatiellia bacterium]
MSPRSISFVFFGLALWYHSLARAGFPLKSIAIREARLLTDWRMFVVPAGQEEDYDASAPEYAEERETWPGVQVPSVWDQPPGKVRTPVPAQVAWYRHRVRIPEEWHGDVSLCFLGVSYTADVFVNGEYLTLHRGGYTPFLVQIPGENPPPRDLEILVRVDNRLSKKTIPKNNTGWEIYGGITREVYLIHQPPARPENLFVRTRPGGGQSWNLDLSADLKGEMTGPLHIRLFNGERLLGERRVDTQSESIELSLSIDNPSLWSPSSPFLHTLELSWGKDRLRLPVGFREITFSEGRLLLNGEALWLQGFGQHEFYPGSGPILSSDQRRLDLVRMKEDFAANAYRAGHYPNHPDIYNLADELGFLVFTEIPAWQNNTRFLAGDVWENWLNPQLTEMVTHFRNHPSVFAWGVSNEIGGAHDYVRGARARILELDPTRPVSAVIAKESDFELNHITDLAARNLHYGWYHSRSVYALREGLRRNLEAAGDTPVWVAELGGMASPGRLGGGYSDEVRGTETYQDKMTRFGLQYIMSNADRMVGISLWTWSDYQRGGHPHDHGILGPDRAPKLAAYAAVNLMRPDTVVLALENETVIPVGNGFNVELLVFTRKPSAGARYSLRAEIRRGGDILMEERFAVELAEGYVTPVGELTWTVPADASVGVHHLYVALYENETLIHSQALPFEPVETSRPGVLRLEPPADGRIHTVEINGMPLRVYPHVGLQLALPAGTHELRGRNGLQSFKIGEAGFRSVAWE